MATQTSTHIYHTQSMDIAVDYYQRKIAEADEHIAQAHRVIDFTSHGEDSHEALGYWEGVKSAYESALKLTIEARLPALVEA